MKKIVTPILFVFFVLGSVFYFAPSLFFDEPLRADISLKPDDQDLVDPVSYTHLTLPTTSTV